MIEATSTKSKGLWYDPKVVPLGVKEPKEEELIESEANKLLEQVRNEPESQIANKIGELLTYLKSDEKNRKAILIELRRIVRYATSAKTWKFTVSRDKEGLIKSVEAKEVI